ncbi:MAG: hypothetical protein H7Z17_18885 [Fuerstia sp.]|nr:hypothetical protein [Fuerstiella sp.]
MAEYFDVTSDSFGLRQPAAAFVSQPAGRQSDNAQAHAQTQSQCAAAGCEHESGSRLLQSRAFGD